MLDQVVDIRSFVADSFKELDFFRHTFEEFIKNEASKEFASLKASSEQLPAHQRDAYIDFNIPYWWDQIFELNLRRAYVLTSFAAFERHLTDLMTITANFVPTPIRSSQLHGSLIERAQVWLTQLANFRSATDDQWAVARELYALRNCIAHNGGTLRRDRMDARLTELANRAPDLDCSGDEVKIDVNFGKWMTDNLASLVDVLYADLETLLIRREKFGAR